MKIFVNTVLAAFFMLLSTGLCLAVDAKPAKAVNETVKADTSAKGVTQVKSSDAKSILVDINSASEAELRAIPGIGDAYAAKIIAGRPYANKAQLKSRKVLPSTLYEQVKEKIIAKQPKK